MVELGMPVVSRDGHKVGRVEHIIDRNTDLPPGLVVTMPRVFGLCHRQVALTTFDVRDVRAGSLVLRISRWDVRNRAAHAVSALARHAVTPGALIPAAS